MSFVRTTHRYPYHTGGMIYYEGSRRQRGGNLFSALKRMIMPSATNVLKKVGKEAVKRGVALSAGALKDKLLNKDVTLQDAFRNRTAQALEKAVTDVDGLLSSQDGAGLRRRRRKRKASQARSGPARKRRRISGGRKGRRRRRRSKPLKRLKRKSINNIRKRRRGKGRRRRKLADIFG